MIIHLSLPQAGLDTGQRSHTLALLSKASISTLETIEIHLYHDSYLINLDDFVEWANEAFWTSLRLKMGHLRQCWNLRLIVYSTKFNDLRDLDAKVEEVFNSIKTYVEAQMETLHKQGRLHIHLRLT